LPKVLATAAEVSALPDTRRGDGRRVDRRLAPGATTLPVRRLCALAVIVLTAARGDIAGANREIPLMRAGGVYQVEATLNGWLVRPFIVDSGAADVQVSADVFVALYPRGSSPRFLPGVSYRLGDGSVVRSQRFVLQSLRIGDHVFSQVSASIGSPGAPLLLGQTVLTRLGTWTIDNERGVLVLAGTAPGASGKECSSWRTAPSTCAVGAMRDFFRDVHPRHDVTSLRLLESDGDRATVLVDVVRPAGRRHPARLCGPMQLRRESERWRVAGGADLREIPSGARCVP
jgi:hypothetical protein